MNALCPTCGQQIEPLTLAVCLQSNAATRLGRTVKLTPKQAEILHVLIERAPQSAKTANIIARVWGHGGGPDGGTNTVAVMISYMRVTLAPLGVQIVNIRKTGYRLVFEEPAALQEVA